MNWDIDIGPRYCDVCGGVRPGYDIAAASDEERCIGHTRRDVAHRPHLFDPDQGKPERCWICLEPEGDLLHTDGEMDPTRDGNLLP